MQTLREDKAKFIKYKEKELKMLKTHMDEATIHNQKMLTEIIDIDARRCKLLEDFRKKAEEFAKLSKELENVEEIVKLKTTESQSSIDMLEADIKNLEYERLDPSPVNSLDLRISSLESSLECPVCFDKASAPIWQCPLQHMVCR